jgi:hypothetical protein
MVLLPAEIVIGQLCVVLIVGSVFARIAPPAWTAGLPNA